MLVGLVRLDLRIHDSSSLKRKRQVVKALIEGVKRKFNVSVAEVDHHELWQRTAIGVSAVGNQGYHVKRVLLEVERFVDARPEVEVISSESTIHDIDD